MFQLSCDYRMEKIDDNIFLSIYELYVRLLYAGANVVFFDDLIRDRFVTKPSFEILLLEHLKKLNLPTDFLLTPSNCPNLILWGSGLQSEWYKKNTLCGKAGYFKNVISDYDDLIRLGLISRINDFYILPSAVQNTYEILKKIENYGLSSSIIKRAII